MQRFVYDKAVEWCKTKDSERKPLLLEGARQVGKTWLAREIGKNEFENYIELNFENHPEIRTLFEDDFKIERILLAISAFTGKDIKPGKTLLFFDEIQWARRGLLALKYFFDNAPQLHVMAAGSLLGVIDHHDDSFPVGKVTFLKINPMTFSEFMMATGNQKLYEIMQTGDWKLINVFANQYENLLRNYYFVGGMPEAVKKFIDTGDYKKVRKVQDDLLKSYKNDFSKHPPKDVSARMHLVWDSIPTHLSKENKKFVYSAVRPGARAKDFETAIQWLKDAGTIHKLTRVSTGEMPLRGFEDSESFKIYLIDIGLLSAMCKLDRKTLIDGVGFYNQYKGALTEQYVLQELIGNEDIELHYWSPDTGHSELDFVIQAGNDVAPLEAKAERNLKAKSLKSFSERYNTKLRFRTSMSPFVASDYVIDIPLYAVAKVPEIMREGL
ncbi:MAG: ATP-binding protein [Salinivirgaceae bacterium]|nr:ATP-binding protein [Salinivirgaceae bacterium]